MPELRCRRAVILGALALSIAVSATWASSASAVIVTLANGKTLSYQPLRSSAPRPFDSIFHNLDYNGGPVMPSNTDYAVYWSPSGLSAFPPDYQPGLNQYFTDLAHDSGGHQNVDSVSTQYNDSAGNFAGYNTSFGGALLDTDPYPASQCPAAQPVTNCLTDAQIQTELASFIAAHGLPRDLTHEYFLFKPPHVEDCLDSNPRDPAGPYGGCSAGEPKRIAVYCAYHGNSLTVPTFVYADDPYVTGIGGCDDGHHPNGTSDGALEGGVSHEHNESITDPIPNSAWTDFGSAVGGEIGDKCAQAMGSPLGTAPNGSPYNQIINGHLYWYQEEWSNQGNACVQRFTFAGAEPTAQFTSTAGSGPAMTFDATGSTAPGGVAQYNFQYNDGPGSSPSLPNEQTTPSFTHVFPAAGTYDVALTVFAPDGTSIGTARVIKTGDEGPTAAFSVSTNPTAGRPTSFSGAASSDPDGAISSYSWNFGDGSLPATGVAPSHTYATAGAFNVTLQVTDVLGQTASTSKQVTIGVPSVANDEFPNAAFSVTPKHPGSGQPTSFNGARSRDPDGSIRSYRWSFGDGSVASSGPSPRHRYRHPGTYAVRLTVTDSSGLSVSTTESVKMARAARVTKIATAVDGQGEFVLVKVNGPGTLTIGHKRFHIRRAKTVRFKVRLSAAQLLGLQRTHGLTIKIKIRFVPAAGLTFAKAKRLEFRF